MVSLSLGAPTQSAICQLCSSINVGVESFRILIRATCFLNFIYKSAKSKNTGLDVAYVLTICWLDDGTSSQASSFTTFIPI